MSWGAASETKVPRFARNDIHDINNDIHEGELYAALKRRSSTKS